MMTLTTNFINRLSNKETFSIGENCTIIPSTLHEGKVHISFEVDINQLITTIHNQQLKGLSKYGVSIEDCHIDKHDWNIMKLEEVADGIVYSLKELQVDEYYDALASARDDKYLSNGWFLAK